MKKHNIRLLAICTIITFQTYAQTLVGIYNHTLSISPNYTVNNNTSINVTGQVINLGTTNITGDIHVNIAIDTSSTSLPKYYWRSTMSYPVINLPPNGIISFNVSDVASDNNSYKVAGNGTTVVAWPIVGTLNDSLTCADSAFTNIYILPLTQDITELGLLERQLQNIPNPLTQDIQFTNTENWTIVLIDMNGKETEIRNFKLEILDYSKGLYLFRFRNKDGNNFTKKVIIN